jgi:hypothetical protein
VTEFTTPNRTSKPFEQYCLLIVLTLACIVCYLGCRLPCEVTLRNVESQLLRRSKTQHVDVAAPDSCSLNVSHSVNINQINHATRALPTICTVTASATSPGPSACLDRPSITISASPGTAAERPTNEQLWKSIPTSPRSRGHGQLWHWIRGLRQ